MLMIKLEQEHTLLQRIAGNDEQAFEVLFMAYHDALGAFINSLLDDRESTREVVQDIFTKIWLQRTKLSEVMDFNAYLFIISRNYTLNKIRTLACEQRRYDRYKNIYDQDMHGDVDDLEAMEQRYELLEKALYQLPPQQQRVFVLRRQGLKNPEIAKALNISTDSVAKYQQLALRTLSDYVKKYDLILPLYLVIAGILF